MNNDIIADSGNTTILYGLRITNSKNANIINNTIAAKYFYHQLMVYI
jgi:hypothetical protein